MGSLLAVKLLCFITIVSFYIGLIQSSTTLTRNRRITMGTMAKIGQFPYVVHVYWFFFDYSVSPSVTSRFRCSGVLVHKLFVLTAANCFQELIDYHKKRDNTRFELDLSGFPTEISAGFVDKSSSNDFGPKSQLRAGERLFVHDDFLHATSMFDVDVALIRVNSPWNFQQPENNVKKLTIGKPPKAPEAWMECHAAGFGNFNTTRVPKNDSFTGDTGALPRRNIRLRFYDLRVGKVKFCKYLQKKLNNKIFHVDDFYLCGDSKTDNGRGQTCFGDSGAPLVCNGLLLGVFSQRREIKPCDVTGFSLFTAVGSGVVQDWMLRIVPDLQLAVDFPEGDPWDVTAMVALNVSTAEGG